MVPGVDFETVMLAMKCAFRVIEIIFRDVDWRTGIGAMKCCFRVIEVIFRDVDGRLAISGRSIVSE